MKEIEIVIPGEPVAKGRPRYTKKGFAYTPKKTEMWENKCQRYMQQAKEEFKIKELIDNKIELEIEAVFTLPQSNYRKKPINRKPHCKRPDIDNIIKIVMDAGNGVLWQDDKLITVVKAVKITGAQGEAPYTKIVVTY